MLSAMPDKTESQPDKALMFGASDRIELIATIVLAVATILTAWSAFQAGKWSGHQAINFSEAGAARTESTRADTRAGQLLQIDVAMYTDWASAFIEEATDGTIALELVDYDPTPSTVSGFFALRFRDEFQPAFDAWLATDPVNNSDAPKSPFAMDEYALADALLADSLTDTADEKAELARKANQNGDNYVLTMVLFASVLFFAGVSSKMEVRRNRALALGFGVLLLVSGILILGTLPILTLNA